MSQLVDLSQILSVQELEDKAREMMPSMAYEFVASGAGDEITLHWNNDAFDRIQLEQRVLTGIDTVDTTTRLFGKPMPTPIMLAPTAYHRVLHPDGEVATAKGASTVGATWVVSSGSTTPIEEIARSATSPLWFQLYVQTDRGFTQEVIHRVVSAGCEAICITVDTPVLGVRNRQVRAKFALPEGVSTPHLIGTRADPTAIMDAGRVALTWKDVEWIMSMTNVPVVLKGILNPDDAERACEVGVAAIIVSNHGGRNLDTLPSTIEALPAIVQRIGDRVPILLDGGIRRGTDIIKAICLGAAAVLIGRPYCFGLALGGAAGVARCVDMLRRELELTMVLAGRRTIGDIDPSVIRL